VKEGLDEEALALFDLLLKPELSTQETRRIKKVAEGLYNTIQKELKRIQDFAAKQSTRAEVKVRIKDYLWDEKTGLPASFEPDDIEEKTDAVFAYLLTRERLARAEPMAAGVPS
jgi:type I restriction enzyme R subunit